MAGDPAIARPRLHGSPPSRIAVLHGGPGAPGSARGLARALASGRGVLECLQSATSVDGQVEELRAQLEAHAAPPLAVVGHSWGAWLGSLLAAKHAHLVGVLVLVGSGPFEASYADQILPRRLARLTEEEAAEARCCLADLDRPDAPADALARLGALFGKADAYDPLPSDEDALVEDEPLALQPAVYASVWREANELRRSGELLSWAGMVRCPVLAIHGADDPHPAEGVAAPLSRVLGDFRLVLLDRCGHEPWRERWARAAFLDALERELAVAGY